MNKILNLGSQTFSSLTIRNYRLYFIGQGISLSGTWMQAISQGLLVLQLTGSGTVLGLVTALQFLPLLLIGPWAGVIIDRIPKRKLLLITQFSAGTLALLLGLLVSFHIVVLWMVYILALALGIVNAFDIPGRQTFVLEMVGKEQISNAVSLNSIEVNIARVIGPALSGIIIASAGLAECFIINAISYIAVIIGLLLINSRELHSAPLTARSKGQLVEGFKYVKSTLVLRNTLLMIGIIGTFSYEFQVILPLFAKFTLHGSGGTYAALTTAMGIGAIIGGLFTANRHKTGPKEFVFAAYLFGISILLLTIVSSFILAFLVLILVGIFSINFLSLGNIILQLESTPQMRGRVMALWSLAFLGSTPIGGPIIGGIGEFAGPRFGLALGGIAAIAAAMIGKILFRNSKQHYAIANISTLDSEVASEKDSRPL